MDDAPSKPNFFERLINRLTGDAFPTENEYTANHNSRVDRATARAATRCKGRVMKWLI